MPGYPRPQKTVDGAAEHLVAYPLVHRQGFSGHNGLVHRSLTTEYGTIHRDGLPGQNPQHIPLPDIRRRDQLFPAVPQPSALNRCQTDQPLDALLGAVSGHLLQNCADGHDKGHLPRSKDISDGCRSGHGNGDKQRGGDPADTWVMEQPPHRQICQRDTADNHCHPGRVHRQGKSYPRQKKASCKEYTSYQRHRQSRQKITDPFYHDSFPFLPGDALDSRLLLSYNTYDIVHFVSLS